MKIRKIINKNITTLLKSEKTFEDLYEIIFSHNDFVMAEYSTIARKVLYTYKEAKRDIEFVAKALSSTVKSTDRFIGIYAENCSEWIVLFWAILKSGNKPYLINLRQPTDFTCEILKTLGIDYVVYRDKIENLGVNSLGYNSLLTIGRTIDEPLNCKFANEFALSTSGTTLHKKICIYSGNEICEQILNVVGIVKKNPDIVSAYRGKIKLLAFLPLYHIFGFEAMYMWFAFWGSTFVFLSDYNPENILRTVRMHDVTHIFAVPLLWNSIEKKLNRTISSQSEKLQKKFNFAVKLSLKVQNVFPCIGRKLAKKLFFEVQAKLFGPSVRFCISGGSYIKNSTLKLINAIGYPLYNGYGMSEVGITSVELSKRVSRRIQASIGKPFDSVSYRLDDKGRLLIKGVSVCKKILVDGTESVCEDWFDTGDIMSVDKQGNYYIHGRNSDIVFDASGENLNPDFAEKEFVITNAKNFCVLGNESGEKLMLVVEISKNLLQTQKKRLLSDIEKCNASLPISYQIRQIKFTYDAIMDEKAIKVSRSYLKNAIIFGKVKLFEDLEINEDFINDDTSEIKVILRQMFAKILEKDVSLISDSAHFMNDLGGSSLDYFTLVSEIDERFNITVNFESDGFHYCINDFERLIKEMIN